jgi:hypothetical protein
VAGRDVDSKSGRLEELFVTVGTLEREVAFMGFEMVIHGILTVLRNATVRTTKCAIGIFVIDGGSGGRRGCHIGVYSPTGKGHDQFSRQHGGRRGS